MYDDLHIMIPSRSRPWNQKTISNLSHDLWQYISIVVPFDQYDTYRAALSIELDVIPFGGTGIGLKREFMLQSMPKTGKLIMLDDDLTFYKRNDEGNFTKATLEDTLTMITDLWVLMEQYPYVGLVDKFMSQTKPRGYAECQRFNQVLGFNRDTMPCPWPKFRLDFGHEEHDMHLQFLTRGIKTAVSTEWSKTDTHNANGGCSDWRCFERYQQEQAKILALWPTIVTAKDEKDVRYNWRAAKRIGGIV